ncbi:MAG: hypothetical protein M3Z20_22085 [Chloroflexota bacterium]|nr:hypothetical protein [Chloroflexota bacterium]
MIYVKNDEEAYVRWLDANANGFVVNMHTLGKNKSLLHRARCMHLFPPEPGKVHTIAYPKACSCDLEEVRQWVIDSGSAIELCTTCKP